MDSGLTSNWAFVVFDLPTNGTCSPDPDVAGIGVVLSFSVSSLIATTCSIYAAILDSTTNDRKAFLPQWWKSWLRRNIDDVKLKRSLRRRAILDRVILGFADQQLATGICLLVSGYIKTAEVGREYFQGAHFDLIIYLSGLSSSSHLAAVITLRKYLETHKVSGIIRVCLIVLYALFLCCSIIISNTFSPFVQVSSVVVTVPYIGGLIPVFAISYGFWIAVIHLNNGVRQGTEGIILKTWSFCNFHLGIGRLRIWSQIWLNGRAYHTLVSLGKGMNVVFWALLFASPFTVFLLQILFATLAVTFVMAQKFMTNPVAGGCDLSSSEENVWGFGQTLPMFFLLIPGLSALETYFEVKTAEMATLHPGPVVPPQAHIPSHHSASTVTEPSEEHKLLSYPSPNQSNSEYSRAKQRSPNPPNLANDASGANLGTHDEQIQFTPQDEWLRRPTRIDTEMRIGTELPQGDSGTASILTGVEEHPFQPARRHIASSTG